MKALIIAALWLPVVASAQPSAYSDLLRDLATKRFYPLQMLTNDVLNLRLAPGSGVPLALAAGPSGSRLRLKGESVTLEGDDLAGKPWSVELFSRVACMNQFGVPVYEGDIDDNGIQDAILLQPTCGVGQAPLYIFMAVTFDGTGRPYLFQIANYTQFTRVERSNAIDTLVDANQDGKADLLVLTLTSANGVGVDTWAVVFYSVQDGLWQRRDGGSLDKEFPVFPLVPLYETDNKPQTQRADVRMNDLWLPDLSNRLPQLEGTLQGWEWPPDPEKGDGMRFVISASGDANHVCTPPPWSVLLTIDTPSGRRILPLNDDYRIEDEDILSRLLVSKHSLRLFGKQDQGKCSPTTVWVTVAGPSSGKGRL